jgi:hypothetical protein
MAKAFGILLIVIGVWVGAEVFTKGVDGAFGGAFSILSGESAPEEDYRWAGERAGDALGRAHDETEARRREMIGE